MSTDSMLLYDYVRKDAPNFHIDVHVSYKLGGINWFTGNHEKRGYYIDVQPIERRDGWQVMTAFTGVKGCIREAKRFSASALKKLHQDILADVEGEFGNYVQQLVEYVLTKNSLDIGDYTLVKGE